MNADNAYKPKISINKPDNLGNENLLRKALELRSSASALAIDIQTDNRNVFNKPIINKEKANNDQNNIINQRLYNNFDINSLPK